jgi:hypothetical protein
MFKTLFENLTIAPAPKPLGFEYGAMTELRAAAEKSTARVWQIPLAVIDTRTLDLYPGSVYELISESAKSPFARYEKIQLVPTFDEKGRFTPKVVTHLRKNFEEPENEPETTDLVILNDDPSTISACPEYFSEGFKALAMYGVELVVKDIQPELAVARMMGLTYTPITSQTIYDPSMPRSVRQIFTGGDFTATPRMPDEIRQLNAILSRRKLAALGVMVAAAPDK